MSTHLIANDHNHKSFLIKGTSDDVDVEVYKQKYGKTMNKYGARWSNQAGGWTIPNEKFEAMRKDDRMKHLIKFQEELASPVLKRSSSRKNENTEVKRSSTRKEENRKESVESNHSERAEFNSPLKRDTSNGGRESLNNNNKKFSNRTETPVKRKYQESFSSEEEEDESPKSVPIKEYRRSKQYDNDDDVVTLSRKISSLERRDTLREKELKELRNRFNNK